VKFPKNIRPSVDFRFQAQSLFLVARCLGIYHVHPQGLNLVGHPVYISLNPGALCFKIPYRPGFSKKGHIYPGKIYYRKTGNLLRFYRPAHRKKNKKHHTKLLHSYPPKLSLIISYFAKNS
jgi:hypothetical protein